MFCDAGDHEANHSQTDHGFSGCGLPFVISAEPPGTAQPSESTLDDPSSRKDFERVQLGAFHDLDHTAPGFFGLFHKRSGVAAVGPDMLDGSLCFPGEESSQQLVSCIPVLEVGRQDYHHEDQADGIDQDVSLATIDLFACVVAAFFAHLRAFDGLAVDNRSAGLGFASFELAQVFSQVIVNFFQEPIDLPETEVMIDRAPRGEVLGQVAPLATGFHDIEDRVEQLPEGMHPWPAVFGRLGEAVIDVLPFVVSEVRCISHRKRITDCGTTYKLTLKECLSYFSDRLLVKSPFVLWR